VRQIGLLNAGDILLLIVDAIQQMDAGGILEQVEVDGAQI
jgi:hypothetical protein